MQTTQISPGPTEEEAVAIVAAMEALWPRPVVVAISAGARNPTWRFSGRWWTDRLSNRVARPWG